MKLKAAGESNLIYRLARYLKFYFALSSTDRPKSLEALINFCVDGPILLAQVRSEIIELGRVLKASPPRLCLEIGTNYGGSLLLLCALAAPDACIISVDLPAGPFGGGYPLRKLPLFHRFPRAQQRLHLLRADSHDPMTKKRVLEILRGQQLDFVFIDADHTYKGVESDFRMYSPLVRPGGMVAFHDIVKYSGNSSAEVDRFWNEIKNQYRHIEFVEGLRNGALPIAVTKAPMETSGIGVLFIPDSAVASTGPAKER